MKKIIFLFITMGLLAACNDTAKGFKKKSDREADNKDRDNKDYTDDRNDEEGDRDRNRNDGWSKKDRNYFLDGCEKEAQGSPQARQLCACVLEKLEKKYSSLKEADNKGGEEIGSKFARECANGGGYDDDSNDDN